MSSSSNNLATAAVVQMVSGLELEKNLAQAKSQLVEEEQRSVRFDHRQDVLFPEYSRFLQRKKCELKGNIRVFCRVRPLISSELGASRIARDSSAASKRTQRL